MEFHIPTLENAQSSEKLKQTILTSEPNAEVNVDLNSQKVTIDSEASKETFEQLIVASGHKIS